MQEDKAVLLFEAEAAKAPERFRRAATPAVVAMLGILATRVYGMVEYQYICESRKTPQPSKDLVKNTSTRRGLQKRGTALL